MNTEESKNGYALELTCSHIPAEYGRPAVNTGMTRREVIKALRQFEKWRFGNIGACRVEFFDGTAIVVECWQSERGVRLMSSQIITLEEWGDNGPHTVRKYKW